MNSVLICHSCGSSLSSNSKVCSSCGCDLYKNMMRPSITTSHQAAHSNIRSRVGTVAGWLHTKIRTSCTPGTNQDWSEFEREFSENGSSDELSRLQTETDYIRYPRPHALLKQSSSPISDDPKRSVGSSTRDSMSSSNHFTAPFGVLAQNEKRDAEIQTDTSIVIMRTSGMRQRKLSQSEEEQRAPFLYRLMEDEARAKRMHIRRTRGSSKQAKNGQMTRSSPAFLFNNFREESSGFRLNQHQEILQPPKQNSHQHYPYEHMIGKMNSERGSFRNSNQMKSLPPRTATETPFRSVPHQILFSESSRTGVRLFFMFFVAILFCFVIYSIIEIYRMDISKKESSKMLEIHRESSECRRKFLENSCNAEKRIRHLEGFCNELVGCMSKDPSKEVLKTYIIAELLSGNINTFAKDLHWKSMIFIFFLLSLFLTCCTLLPSKIGGYSSSNGHFPAIPVEYRQLDLRNQKQAVRTVN